MLGYLKILAYHSVNDSGNRAIHRRNIVDTRAFEEQLGYLVTNYRVVPLEEIWRRLSARTLRAGKVVALTFDDGYRDFYDTVYPLLKREGIPATVFLCPSFLDRPYGKWDDQLSLLLGASCDEASFLHRLHSAVPGREFSSYGDVVHFLQRQGPEELAGILRGVDSLCQGISMPRIMLNWEEALALSRAPNITIGSHTLSHYNLTTLNQETLRRELRDAKTLLEERLKIRVESLCYPFGFCNETVKRSAAEVGYSYAVGCGNRYNTGKDDTYEMMRVMVDDLPLEAFGRRLSSTFYLLRVLKRRCLAPFCPGN